MVKVTAINVVTGKTLQQMELALQEKARALRIAVGERIADTIVDASPVDTGTYIMAHKASGTDGGSAEADRSSHGKPRGRSTAQFKGLAKGNLKRSVSAAAMQNATEIWFQNSSLHAGRVESLGWPAPLFGNPNSSGPHPSPYRPYTKARASVGKHIRAAARELGFTTR
jgi:hypothetical protein